MPAMQKTVLKQMILYKARIIFFISLKPKILAFNTRDNDQNQKTTSS